MKPINKFAFMIALASITLLSVNYAFAQASNSMPMDTTFAKKAASGGMAEVKLGKLAQENGMNRAVKEFGKRMEKDHSKAADQLKNVASKNNVDLPADM